MKSKSLGEAVVILRRTLILGQSAIPSKWKELLELTKLHEYLLTPETSKVSRASQISQHK